MSLNICVLINNIYIYYISVLYVVQSVYIAYSTYVYCTLARIHSNVTNSNPIRPNVNEVSALSSATKAMTATTMAVMLRTRPAASEAPLVAAVSRLAFSPSSPKRDLEGGGGFQEL